MKLVLSGCACILLQSENIRVRINLSKQGFWIILGQISIKLNFWTPEQRIWIQNSSKEHHTILWRCIGLWMLSWSRRVKPWTFKICCSNCEWRTHLGFNLQYRARSTLQQFVGHRAPMFWSHCMVPHASKQQKTVTPPHLPGTLLLIPECTVGQCYRASANRCFIAFFWTRSSILDRGETNLGCLNVIFIKCKRKIIERRDN